MIQDARVFDEEFVPSEVRHRDQEVNELVRALEPVLEGDPAQTAFLYGPSGVGKTCISQYTVENELQRRILDLNTTYVNCWQNYTRYRTLYKILEEINQTLDIHRQSTPKDELLERLQEYDGPQYVVILDEVDQLQDKDVLYDLYNTRDISMVLIANREEEFFAQLDGRLQSRLHSSRRVLFERYHLDELVAILEDRVRWGLRRDAVDTEGLRLIADSAAGDARKAINILRIAARDAEHEGFETISTEVIEEAVPEVVSYVQQKNLDKLTPDQQMLYEIIQEQEEIGPSKLYELYQDRVEEPKSDRTVRNYLQKMRQYDLIEAKGEKRGRTYRIMD